MERMMDAMNGGMETSTPMPEMGTTDGGAMERPRPKRASRPKRAKKSGGSKSKAKARKSGGARGKSKTRAKARKSGTRKRAKKGGRRR
jgi:hypothetical protein